MFKLIIIFNCRNIDYHIIVCFHTKYKPKEDFARIKLIFYWSNYLGLWIEGISNWIFPSVEGICISSVSTRLNNNETLQAGLNYISLKKLYCITFINNLLYCIFNKVLNYHWFTLKYYNDLYVKLNIVLFDKSTI